MDIASKDIAKGKKKSGSREKFGKALIFLAPSLLLMLIFFIGPIIMTFFFSFTNMSLTGASAKNVSFIGIENFTSMFKDPSFKIVILNSIVFLVFSAIVGQQVLGFLVALLMKQKNRIFRSIIGTIVIAGWVTPEVICAFAFTAFFGDHGTLNQILKSIHVQPVSWLYQHPMLSIVIANIWHGTAFSMLMFQAGLDDIPDSVEEAAMIDGANGWQRLWRITIPIIKNTITTNLVIITLQTLGMFTLIYTMTGGGPAGKTSTLPIFMYEQAFKNYQLGYGTAISLILLLIGIIFSLLYIRLLRTNE